MKNRYQPPKDISPSHNVKESEKNILGSVPFFQTGSEVHTQTSLMKYFPLKCKVKYPSDSKHYYYLEVRISRLKSLLFFPLHLFNKLETRSFCLRFVWSRRNRPTYLWERWSWMKFGSKHAGGSSHFCLRKSGSEVKKGGGGWLWECGESQTLFWAGREGIPRASTGGSTKNHICRDGSDRNKTDSGCTQSDVNVSHCHACTSPLVNQEHLCMSDSCTATLTTSLCVH